MRINTGSTRRRPARNQVLNKTLNQRELLGRECMRDELHWLVPVLLHDELDLLAQLFDSLVNRLQRRGELKC